LQAPGGGAALFLSIPRRPSLFSSLKQLDKSRTATKFLRNLIFFSLSRSDQEISPPPFRGVDFSDLEALKRTTAATSFPDS